MPTYEYFCPSNGQTVEVYHSITIDLANWGQLCSTAGVDVGETPPDAPIERLIFAPNITTPMGNSKLKEMGFTKLVRRDQGVYAAPRIGRHAWPSVRFLNCRGGNG